MSASDDRGSVAVETAVIAPALASTESPGNGQAAAQRRRVHHVGYNTLFPLLLTLLDPARDEVQLLALLKVLRDPKKLWSPHGLRSLSADDLFYGQENAPGDAPYWRGAIWMPINFLALRALKHYSADADAAGLGGGGSGGSAAVREDAAAKLAAAETSDAHAAALDKLTAELEEAKRRLAEEAERSQWELETTKRRLVDEAERASTAPAIPAT